MTVLINVSFVAAWTPFAVLCFWTAFADADSVLYSLALISPLCVKTSTLFNPIIYYCTNEKLRKAIRTVLGLESSENFNENSLSSVSSFRGVGAGGLSFSSANNNSANQPTRCNRPRTSTSLSYVTSYL